MATENKTIETVETDRISNETPNDGLNTPEADEVSKETPIEQEQTKANKEAAKYRRQLREVEEVRDQLEASLTATREQVLHLLLENLTEIKTSRNGLESTAQVKLNHPTDLEKFTGKTANDLLGDDGNIDKTKLADLLGNLYAERSDLFTRRNKVPNIWGRPEGKPQSNSWQEAFTPNSN